MTGALGRASLQLAVADYLQQIKWLAPAVKTLLKFSDVSCVTEAGIDI
ncbi:hypothetical protein [Pseudomonas borbori]|nr:hypothetical protein [Pseudomonas borbori]